MTYDDFCERIKGALETAERPLTWTEIRTSLKLPQAAPNNKWVRRMEGDIGLTRERDKTGKTLWRLQ